MSPRAVPVYLLGAPRSGTSLLYKALSLHPEAAYISNYVHRVPAVPALGLLNRLGARSPDRMRAAWFPNGNAYAFGRRRALWERVMPSPAEGEPVFRSAGVTTAPVSSADAVDSAVAARLDRRLARVARWGGGSRLFVKRIANNRRIPVLRSASPDARFVQLTRDGRAVALSLTRVDWWSAMRLWWLGSTPPEWVASGGDELELAARHWDREVQALDDGLDGLDGERLLRIRYEDLVADPVGTLVEVARFSGLDPDDAKWRRSIELLSFPDQNEQWRTQLDEATLARIEEAVGPTLQRLGYDIAGRP